MMTLRILPKPSKRLRVYCQMSIGDSSLLKKLPLLPPIIPLSASIYSLILHHQFNDELTKQTKQ
jgi:hypothetical protein